MIAEAIHPYLGSKTNHVTNGMLLRADIHTLFDLGLLAIAADHRLLGSDLLLGTEYQALIGKVIAVPEKADVRPSAKALELHRTQRFDTRPSRLVDVHPFRNSLFNRLLAVK